MASTKKESAGEQRRCNGAHLKLHCVLNHVGQPFEEAIGGVDLDTHEVMCAIPLTCRSWAIMYESQPNSP